MTQMQSQVAHNQVGTNGSQRHSPSELLKTERSSEQPSMSGSGLCDFDGNLSVNHNQSTPSSDNATRNNTMSGSDFDWKTAFAGISIDTGMDTVQTVNIAMAGLTIVICGTVVYAQLRSWRELRNVSSFAVFQSVLADFMNGVVLLVSLWIVGQPIAVTASNEMCCYLAWIATFSSYGWSSWSILLVAYQRCESVKRPFHCILTLRRALVVVFAIWVGNVVIAAIPMTGLIRKPGLLRFPDNKTGICLPNRDNIWGQREIAYVICLVTLTAFLPLLTAAFYFIRVLAVAWRSLRVSEERTRQFSGIEDAAHRHTLKLLKSRGFQCIMAIITSKLLIVTPFQFAYILKVTQGFPGKTAMRAFSMMYSANFIIDSILYVFWLKTLRLQLATLLCLRHAHPKLPDWVELPHTSKKVTATTTEASRSSNQGRNGIATGSTVNLA